MTKYIFNEDYKNLNSEELWNKITSYITHSKKIVTATGHSYEAELDNDFIHYKAEKELIKEIPKTETMSKSHRLAQRKGEAIY